jgi:hypothetical protein
MRNSERELRNEERPAGDIGWPFGISWWLGCLVLGLGCGFGFIAGAIAVGSIWVNVRPNASIDYGLLFLFTAILGIEPIVVCSYWTALGTKWQQKVSEVTGWYLIATGIVFGSISVLLLIAAGLLVDYAHLTRTTFLQYVVMGFGPLFAIWWVVGHKRRAAQSIEADYDDSLGDR